METGVALFSEGLEQGLRRDRPCLDTPNNVGTQTERKLLPQTQKRHFLKGPPSEADFRTILGSSCPDCHFFGIHCAPGSSLAWSLPCESAISSPIVQMRK